MRNEVLHCHPWAKFFLCDRKIEAATKLDNFINDCFDEKSIDLGSNKMDILKQVDILRNKSE